MPLVLRDELFEDAAPNLFGATFAKASKDHIDQVKSMQAVVPRKPKSSVFQEGTPPPPPPPTERGGGGGATSGAASRAIVGEAEAQNFTTTGEGSSPRRTQKNFHRPPQPGNKS